MPPHCQGSGATGGAYLQGSQLTQLLASGSGGLLSAYGASSLSALGEAAAVLGSNGLLSLHSPVAALLTASTPGGTSVAGVGTLDLSSTAAASLHAAVRVDVSGGELLLPATPASGLLSMHGGASAVLVGGATGGLQLLAPSPGGPGLSLYGGSALNPLSGAAMALNLLSGAAMALTAATTATVLTQGAQSYLTLDGHAAHLVTGSLSLLASGTGTRVDAGRLTGPAALYSSSNILSLTGGASLLATATSGMLSLGAASGPAILAGGGGGSAAATSVLGASGLDLSSPATAGTGTGVSIHADGQASPLFLAAGASLTVIMQENLKFIVKECALNLSAPSFLQL